MRRVLVPWRPTVGPKMSYDGGCGDVDCALCQKDGHIAALEHAAKKPPHDLDLIVDTVLAYKPKDKAKATKARAKKKAKRDAKKA